MRKILIVVLALALSACGGWNYTFTPDKEDGKPGVDSKCGVVELEKSGFWSTKTYGQGRFCLVEDER